MIHVNLNTKNPFDCQDSIEYFKRTMQFDDDESFDKWFCDSGAKEPALVDEIFAIEYSIFLLRSASGDICGSHIDTLVSLRRKLIEGYNKKFKKQFIEFNKNLYY